MTQVIIVIKPTSDYEKSLVGEIYNIYDLYIL